MKRKSYTTRNPRCMNCKHAFWTAFTGCRFKDRDIKEFNGIICPFWIKLD